MFRYYHTIDKNEVLGISEGDPLPPNVVALDESNPFFSPLPEGQQLVYDSEGLPAGYETAPIIPPSSKQIRDEALEALDYEFADGAIIQTRPKDEAVMRNAIDIMTRESVPSVGWVMKNNAKRLTTAAELTEALRAGQLAAMQVWNNYEPEVIE